MQNDWQNGWARGTVIELTLDYTKGYSGLGLKRESVASVGRYLRNEAAFKVDAFAVLKEHFEGRKAFNK